MNVKDVILTPVAITFRQEVKKKLTKTDLKESFQASFLFTAYKWNISTPFHKLSFIITNAEGKKSEQRENQRHTKYSIEGCCCFFAKSELFVTWDSECCPFGWIACTTTTQFVRRFLSNEMHKLKQVIFKIILSDKRHFNTRIKEHKLLLSDVDYTLEKALLKCMFSLQHSFAVHISIEVQNHGVIFAITVLELWWRLEKSKPMTDKMIGPQVFFVWLSIQCVDM